MDVKLSKSFWNTMIKSLKVSEKDLKTKILEILILDKIIDTNESMSINFEIINESFQGLIYNDWLVYFASKLNNGKTKSRNTYIAQNFLPSYKICKKLNLNLFVTINPFDTNEKIENIISESINFDSRIFKTLNVTLSSFFGNIERFQSIEEFLWFKNKIRNKNKINKSTYIKLEKNNIYVYGKMDGANGNKTFIECLVISKISKHDTYLFPLNPICNNFLKNELINSGIFLEDNTKRDIEISECNNDNNVNRNQPLFLKNIIIKWSNFIDIDSCFACDYDISENLIASHIYRVTDIRQDYENKKITKEEAQNLIVSGDNGFRLCPNHDKEFEKGMIIFDIRKMQFIKNEKFNNLNIEKTLKINLAMDNVDLRTPMFEKCVKLHLYRSTNFNE